MHHAVADEFRVFQCGDHGEHPLLFPEFQVGLKAHQVKDAFRGVVLAELHHRVGLLPGFGVRQSHGLQGTVAQGVRAPAGHDLHRHTALEHILILEAVDLRLLGGGQLLHKGNVLLLVHGAVDIVRGAPVVPGLPPGLLHIDGLRCDQRRGSVKKVQIPGIAKIPADGLAQAVGGQRAGGDDDRPLRHLGHFFRNHRNIGVTANLFRDHFGKAAPVHCQAAAGFHPGSLRAGKDQAAAAAQFFL